MLIRSGDMVTGADVQEVWCRQREDQGGDRSEVIVATRPPVPCTDGGRAVGGSENLAVEARHLMG